MNPLLFDNLLSWSAEVSILVIAAAVAAYAIQHARARLYFWQAILAVSLMLPAIAPWNQPVAVAPPPSALVTLPAERVMAPVAVSTRWGMEQLVVLLAAGTALRMLWMTVGLLRLVRIRNHARLLEQPPVAFTGDVHWYVSDQVRGPVTFGWLRPCILLPAGIQDLPASAQEAAMNCSTSTAATGCL
jgi:beta-lactamase regulating signal transducer with metallopeptidase domain